jgi:hypothetical protein
MIVIMLGGKARVGKTTAANILKVIAENMGMRPVIVPFAKAIKDEATKLGLSKDTKPDLYRAFCQDLGERKRKENPDHWVNAFNQVFEKLAKEENEALESTDKKYKERVVIIDDCRYLNEVAYGRKIGAKQVFIAHGSREIEDLNGEWRQHESEDMANKIETKQKDYDNLFEYRISNDGSMDNFVEVLSQLSLVLFNVIAESLTLCPCEVCTAHRQGRDINYDSLLAEVEELIEDLYKKKEKEK